jgi:hypothetical protein
MDRPKSETSDFGWRDREGACKAIRCAPSNVERARKKIDVHTLTPSPTLPRKRGREQTEFAARAQSTAHEHALTQIPVWYDLFQRNGRDQNKGRPVVATAALSLTRRKHYDVRLR